MKTPFFSAAATLLMILSAIVPQEGLAQVPSNDAFANGIIITGGRGSTIGNNTHASYEEGEPYEDEASAGRTVWWRWTAPSDGIHVFHTAGSSFDTLLAVYTGTQLNQLSLVAYNDEAMGGSQSRVSFEAVAGQTYHLMVDGWGSQGFGRIVLSWLLFPTMVYTWREVVTTQGAEWDDATEDYVWYPRATYTATGLIVRGRSANVTTARYGVEQGPIAFFRFTPVRQGRRTVVHFEISQTLPQPDAEDPSWMKGGFVSYLTQFNRVPIRVYEETYLEQLDSQGGYLFWTNPKGPASLRAPFAGASRFWFASTLTGIDERYRLLDTGDAPVQGLPEWGNYSKIADTVRFSAAETGRVKGLGFADAVAAIRLHLLSKGYVEGAPPP
jgi:hypothetical protein